MKTTLLGLILSVFMLSPFAMADCGSCGGEGKKGHKHTTKEGKYVCEGEDGKKKAKQCKGKDKKACCADRAHKKDSAQPATDSAKPAEAKKPESATTKKASAVAPQKGSTAPEAPAEKAVVPSAKKK